MNNNLEGDRKMDDKKESHNRENFSTEENQQVNVNTTCDEFEAKYAKLVRWDQHVVNADNAYLEPWAAGPFTTGCIYEVNGLGAQEILEFKATRHELLQLVKYWKEIALDSEYWVFISGSIGSRDLRVQPFADRRISRIADLIGEDAVNKVVIEVESEFGKKQDPRAWQIFCHGTAEEREQFQDELERELEASPPGKQEPGKE
jgi:hypothetical protein